MFWRVGGSDSAADRFGAVGCGAVSGAGSNAAGGRWKSFSGESAVRSGSLRFGRGGAIEAAPGWIGLADCVGRAPWLGRCGAVGCGNLSRRRPCGQGVAAGGVAERGRSVVAPGRIVAQWLRKRCCGGVLGVYSTGGLERVGRENLQKKRLREVAVRWGRKGSWVQCCGRVDG